MSAARYDLIDKKVNELFSAYTRFLKVPINLVTLMKTLEIKFEEKDYEGQLSGAAIFNGVEKIVTVNSGESAKRKRFTIAHEIGHLLLHADQTLNVDVEPVTLNRDPSSSSGENWREVEANYFAASLLMPASDVIKSFEKWKNLEEDELLEKLANRYEVSLQAMSIRLGKLGLFVL